MLREQKMLAGAGLMDAAVYVYDSIRNERGVWMRRDQITVAGHYGMSLLMDVPHLLAVGETVVGIGLEIEPGGKGYNQAIAASRLGANVNFITAVGDDDFGYKCEKDLIDEGVQGRYIKMFSGKKTACAFVINSANQESGVYVYPGAIQHMTPEHIRAYRNVIEGSALMLLQNEVSSEALYEVIRIAGEAHVQIIYNPAPAREMPRDILKYVSVITPNETEAAILTGQDPAKPLDIDMAMKALREYGVKNTIITLGSKGSELLTPEGRYHIDPIRGEVVSTTGAGDCYNAALAVHYLETCNLLDSVQYASVAAGMQVMRPGVIANLPYRDETNELYQTYKGKLIHKV